MSLDQLLIFMEVMMRQQRLQLVLKSNIKQSPSIWLDNLGFNKNLNQDQPLAQIDRKH